jgi:putative SOS response-associated peptidase YedK
MWPGYLGSFIRRQPYADVGDEAVPAAEALNGHFGLVPHWSPGTKIARHTYNARTETVVEKPSFRDAWKRGRRCIIPADVINADAHGLMRQFH